MIGLALLVTASIGQGWQPVLDRVAVTLDSYRPTGVAKADFDQFSRAMTKAGLVAIERKKAGLYLPPVSPVRVQGDNGFVLLLVGQPTQKERFPTGGCLAYFQLRNGKLAGHVLEENREDQDLALPSAAAKVGTRLTTFGSLYWMGNGPRAIAEVFAPKGRSWERMDSRATEFESWDAPKLVLNDSGLRPIRLQSRTYPEILDASHATAQTTYDEQWSFKGDKILLDWKRRRNTPYNRLDDLYGALLSGNKSEASAICPDSAVRSKIETAYAKRKSDRPTVVFPNSVSTPDATQIGLANLKLMFTFQKVGTKWVVARVSPLKD